MGAALSAMGRYALPVALSKKKRPLGRFFFDTRALPDAAAYHTQGRNHTPTPSVPLHHHHASVYPYLTRVRQDETRAEFFLDIHHQNFPNLVQR